MVKPRALDLFCGAAGGWSLGLHRAGFTTVAACEIDPWRRAVFARNFPEARLYDDVRDLDAERLAGDGIGAVDLVCGSPPCQDASTANARGRGVDGARTGLFFEAIRLVRQLRPAWAAFENVPGIRARGVDRVLAALEGEGYAVWPLVVGARHAGAPHKRERVWILAYRSGDGCGPGRAGRSHPGIAGQSERPLSHADAAPVLGLAQPGREPDRVGAGTAADAARMRGEGRLPPRSQQDGIAALSARHADGAGLALGQGERGDACEELPPALRAIGKAWPAWNGGVAGIGRVGDGLPRGVARAALAAYGDAIVPQIAEAIGRAILACDPDLAARAAA